MIVRLAGAATGTPACLNKISGTWNFGSVPQACNVSNLQSADFVRAEYGAVLFRDALASQGGRNLYMGEMYPVLRETAKYYIHRRNPAVSPAEEEAFILALLTLTNQESYWTHYREGTDKLIRFMRGDSLHGFGLMQIDDRSHLAAINSGKGVDLVDNMIYGLDIFYASWLKSASVSCVSSASNYKDRTRSAWSAYNGGPGQICRWTNPKSPYHQNDVDFNNRYEKQVWRSYISDFKAPSKIDIVCLAEGTGPCNGVPKPPSPIRTQTQTGWPTASIHRDIHYRFMRECPEIICNLVSGAVRGGESVQVSPNEHQGWVQVVHGESKGWIRRADLGSLP